MGLKSMVRIFINYNLLNGINKEQIYERLLSTYNDINPQFFILSAFVWMTLMSYEIFKQIRGMQVR